MKKAALTIGLLSLVVITTSFTTPETVNTISNAGLNIVPPVIGGGMTGVGGRKLDNHVVKEESIMKNNQSGFDNTNQSLGSNKKLD